MRWILASTPGPRSRASSHSFLLGDRKTLRRGALLFGVALLTLAAGLAHAVGALSQTTASPLLVALLLALAAIQGVTAFAVVGRPTRPVLVAATLLTAGTTSLWLATHTWGLPLGASVWRPETLGAMDFYLPILEASAAIGLLALIGRTLPVGRPLRRALTALPILIGVGLLLLAGLKSSLTAALLVVLFSTTNLPNSLLALFVPAVVLLVALLVARRIWPALRAATPDAPVVAGRLVPVLLAVNLLGAGAVGTALDRAWFASDAPVQAPAGQTTTLSYCAPGGDPLALDLTEPAAGAPRPAPVAVYIHGGEGLVGDRVLQGSEGPYFAQLRDSLVQGGFVVGSLDYRLAPQTPLVDEVADAKCAIRFLRAHATALGIDPQRVGVYGDSEGGYLAAMLGTTGPAAGFDRGPYLDQSSRVQAAVDMWGFTDLTNWTGSPSWVSMLGSALSAGPSSSAATRALSPINDVAPGDPPFLIIHGTADWFIAPHHSIDFAARLRAAGVPVTLVLVQHGGHGLDAAPAGQVQQPSAAALVQQIASFFRDTLSPTRS